MGEFNWVNIIPVLVGGCLSVRQQHMTNISNAISDLPPEQRAIRDKCFHSTGRFVEFKKEEIEQSIPDRFEKIVRNYPDLIAVKTRSHTLTYEALNQTANRVAQAILTRCREGNEPVALLFEHDTPVIATIMGVLKAGKIYVPLDLSFPRARIVSMLDHSQTGVIVTNNYNLPLARQLAQHQQQIINLDQLDAPLNTGNLGLPISPATLATIYYTSGSTGEPKGIVHDHRNVLYMTMTCTNDFHICTNDRLSLLHSYSFGAAVGDIFSALLNGALLFPFRLEEEGISNLATWLIQQPP